MHQHCPTLMRHSCCRDGNGVTCVISWSSIYSDGRICQYLKGSINGYRNVWDANTSAENQLALYSNGHCIFSLKAGRFVCPGSLTGFNPKGSPKHCSLSTGRGLVTGSQYSVLDQGMRSITQSIGGSLVDWGNCISHSHCFTPFPWNHDKSRCMYHME